MYGTIDHSSTPLYSTLVPLILSLNYTLIQMSNAAIPVPGIPRITRKAPAFAGSLLKRLFENENGNFFFSPLKISIAVGMANILRLA